MLLAATALVSGFAAVQYVPSAAQSAGTYGPVRSAAAVMDADADAAHAALMAHLRAHIRQYDGGWADTAGRYGGKDKKKLDQAKESGVWGTGDGKSLEDSYQWTYAAKTAPPPAPPQDAPVVDWSGAPAKNADGTFEGYTGDGNKIVTDGNAANFGRLTDKLKEADVERRLEQEAIEARENAAEIARESLKRKIQLMKDIPDAQKAGTVDDYMYKEGVKDILGAPTTQFRNLWPVAQRCTPRPACSLSPIAGSPPERVRTVTVVLQRSSSMT